MNLCFSRRRRHVCRLADPSSPVAELDHHGNCPAMPERIHEWSNVVVDQALATRDATD